MYWYKVKGGAISLFIKYLHKINLTIIIREVYIFVPVI